MEELKKRYMNNAEFHQLVDVLENLMVTNKITPDEIRDATFIAGMKIHSRTTLPVFSSIPQ